MTLNSRPAFEDYLNGDGSIGFDPYAQNISDWSFLKELIPGIVVSSAGGTGLFQAEGLLDEYPFYFRSETGTASICIAMADGEPHLFTGDTLWYGRCDTDGDLFFMSAEDFIRELLKCMRNLKVAPFLWEFKGQAVRYRNEERPADGWVVLEKEQIFHGYGASAAEGYRAAAQPFTHEKMLALMSVDVQKRLWLDRGVDPTPVNSDSRVFPKTAPRFLELSEELGGA